MYVKSSLASVARGGGRRNVYVYVNVYIRVRGRGRVTCASGGLASVARRAGVRRSVCESSLASVARRAGGGACASESGERGKALRGVVSR